MNKIIEQLWFILCLLTILVVQPSLQAQTNQNNDSIYYVNQWLVSEPITLFLPAFHDQNNVKGEVFSTSDLLKTYPFDYDKPVNSKSETDNKERITKWQVQESSTGGDLPFKVSKDAEISIISQATYIKTSKWTEIKVAIETRQRFELYLNDEKKLSNYKFTANDKDPEKKEVEIKLEPGKNLLLIRSLFEKDTGSNWSVNTKIFPADNNLPIEIESELATEHHMDIDHLLHGKQMQSVSLSPDGKMLMLSYKETFPPEGHSEYWSEVINTESQELIFTSRYSEINNLKWISEAGKLSYLTKEGDIHKLVMFDLHDKNEKILYSNKEDISNYRWAENGAFIIFSRQEKPEVDKSGVKKLEGMPDRWPWWQNRSQLYRLNVNDRSIQRLTYGHIQNSLQDIHPNGKSLLFSQNIPDFSERPYSKHYLINLNLSDLSVDTIWVHNYSSSVSYSPDGKKLLVRGGPALFGESGINVGKGQIPNDYDTQAYIYDLESKTADPITRDFNPSIEQAIWHMTDNQIYIVAEDSTYKRLFQFNPETKEFNNLDARVDVVKSVSAARGTDLIAYAGNSISSPTRVYTLKPEDGKQKLIADPEVDFFTDVQFGKTEEWIFTAKGGHKIDGRIYYPPDFNPDVKYPLIVYYYAGTSPTERSFRGRYPKNLFAAMGYVVYVLQPSGATGYGQEFSARHVNNWGITVADEIIDGTKKFLKAHPFVDPDKVGCIGASYGGFMTMLLTTRTDIFSAAIAHAGISSISSYWGQGYWGYLYSSAASANSFPWNNKEMYVEQSPLFHADKVNTPLLLLTGSADTNVPPGESIQFYTALKLLGKPVELIEIEGENHHILKYKKRILWQKTIFAWFDKWLKGESGWWDELYPDKDL